MVKRRHEKLFKVVLFLYLFYNYPANKSYVTFEIIRELGSELLEDP